MTSCTIIISHYESLPFLRACVRQIRKFRRKDILQFILIVDQSCDDTYFKIYDEYLDDDDIFFTQTKPFYSGYGIDWVIRNFPIETDYIVQLHCDAFPISDKWLHLPIKLIEENDLYFVGQLQFISKPTDTIYLPNPFFAMAQCFNVAKTETYKELSLQAGFTRFHERSKTDMTFENNDWAKWAEQDYGARGSDDDVVAFCWEDKYEEHDKLGLAISGFISPAYGRIIEDIVFHFCSARESIGTGDAMGEQYKEFTRRINEDYNDSLIDEMISLAKTNRPPGMEILSRNFWDGKLKKSFPPPEELNKRIEELKNGMD